MPPVQASKPKFFGLLDHFLGSSGPKVSNFQREIFYKYYLLTLKWGEKINITANLAPETFVAENLADPALAFFAAQTGLGLGAKRAALVDLGCGGGYVGLVWHVLGAGRLETRLVDGDRKKINFCKQAIRELGLGGAGAEQERVEAFIPAHSQQFDLVVSRATWDVPEFFKKAEPLVAPGGVALHFSSAAQAQTYSAYAALPYELGAGGRFLTYIQH